MSRAFLSSLAGFQVTTIGRFWVTAEEEYRQALLLNPKLEWVRKRLETMD